MTFFTTQKNLRSQLISSKVLYKHLKIYNGKSFMQKTLNKTHLWSKIGGYVSTGKTIHDSEKNRKRKAKKKNNKIFTKNIKVLSNIFFVVVKTITAPLKLKFLLISFRINIPRCITRKERAVFILKQFGDLPFNKFSGKLDYAAGFKIMKFGLVGIKVFLNKIKIKLKLIFNFYAKDLVYLNIFFMLGVQAMSKIARNFSCKCILAPSIQNHNNHFMGFHTGTEYTYYTINGKTGYYINKDLAKEHIKLEKSLGNLNVGTVKEIMAQLLEEKKLKELEYDSFTHLPMQEIENSITKHYWVGKPHPLYVDKIIAIFCCTSVEEIKYNKEQFGMQTIKISKSNLKGKEKDQFALIYWQVVDKNKITIYEKTKFDESFFDQTTVKTFLDISSVVLERYIQQLIKIAVAKDPKIKDLLLYTAPIKETTISEEILKLLKEENFSTFDTVAKSSNTTIVVNEEQKQGLKSEINSSLAMALKFYNNLNLKALDELQALENHTTIELCMEKQSKLWQDALSSFFLNKLEQKKLDAENTPVPVSIYPIPHQLPEIPAQIVKKKEKFEIPPFINQETKTPEDNNAKEINKDSTQMATTLPEKSEIINKNEI